VRDFVEAESQQRTKAVEIARGYRPMTLVEHVVRATDFVRAISEKQRAAAAAFSKSPRLISTVFDIC